MTPRDELIEQIAAKHAYGYGYLTDSVQDAMKSALREFAARSDAQVPRSGCEIADMLAGHPPLERRKGERRKHHETAEHFDKLADHDSDLTTRTGTDRRKPNAAAGESAKADSGHAIVPPALKKVK